MLSVSKCPGPFGTFSRKDVTNLRKSKIIFINGFFLTLSTLFVRGLGLVFNIYLSNKIGSEALGVFTLVMSVYSFFITLASSGISLATTCIVSEEIAKNKLSNVQKIMKTCLRFSTLIGITSSILIIICSDFIASSFLTNIIGSYPLYFIALGLPAISLSSVINGYFLSVRNAKKTAIVSILEFIVRISTTIFLLNLLIHKGTEYICISLILGDAISEIFATSMLFILYKCDIKKYSSPVKYSENFKPKILKICVPFAITSYIKSGLSTLKQMLIPLRLEKYGLSSSAALSKYGIINGMVMPIIVFPHMLISSFSGLLVPEFTRYYAAGDFRMIKYVSAKLFNLIFMFSIFIASVFFFFSEEISLLFYNNTECSKFFKILAPLIVLMYFDNIIDSILKGLERQIGVMFCNIADLFTSIGFIYFLLPIFGVEGYIFVIFFSEFLNCTVSLLQLLHLIKVRIHIARYIVLPLMSSFFSYFVLNNIFKISIQNNILDLLINLILFSGFYFGFLFFLQKKKASLPS